MARFTVSGSGGAGVPGPQGPQGPQGESAYEVAVENGFVGTEQEWLDSLGGGGNADIADFIFTAEEGQSVMSLPSDRQMRIQAGENSDLYITADDDLYVQANDDLYLQTVNTGDDIHINAADDIRFSAGEENETIYFWRMDSEGRFQLPGDGYISNPADSSGDPNTPWADTLHLVPDSNVAYDGGNQYIIIDPTAPNHIHVRAGGQMDQSTADLILGGEKNKVAISDTSRSVSISTRPDLIANSYTNLNTNSDTTFIVSNNADIQIGYTVNILGTDYVVDNVMPIEEGIVGITASGAVFEANTSYTFTFNPDWTNSWHFTSNGTLYGPAEGLIKTNGLYGVENTPLILAGPQQVVLTGDSGEFLNDASDSNNQIATIGDLPSQPLETSDSPSFNQVYVTNNNGTGENVKIGDDAWIGDLNVANYIGITGAQDPTVGGIILGNSGTETISASDGNVYINSGGAMTLNAASGDMNFYMDGAAYIGPSSPENRIAQIKDLNSYQNSIGELVQYNSVWSATGLTYTGNPTTASYIKIGKLVQVQIDVSFATVTNFGTGQYKLTLPFPSAYHTDVFGGSVHKTNANTDHFSLKGHLESSTTEFTIWSIGSNAADEVFDHNSPANITIADRFHMAFSYICE